MRELELELEESKRQVAQERAKIQKRDAANIPNKRPNNQVNDAQCHCEPLLRPSPTETESVTGEKQYREAVEEKKGARCLAPRPEFY